MPPYRDGFCHDAGRDAGRCTAGARGGTLAGGALARVPAPLRRPLRELGEGMAELLWPTRCVGCDALGALLCESCRRSMRLIDQEHACPRCGAPFGSLVCTECTDWHVDEREGPGPAPPSAVALLGSALDGVCCAAVLEHPVDALVRVYKDAGERRCAAVLADLLAQAVFSSPVLRGTRYDAIAFVPATPAAYARRGFDHMELVARRLSALAGVDVADVLARGGGADQRGLSRGQRLANVSGDVVALGRLDGARVLLVDDVLTTGATLVACAGALRGAGAVQVMGACVARAW